MTEYLDLPFFLGLEDGRWWEYHDVATGKKGRLECHRPQSANTLALILQVGNDLTEHSLETWETIEPAGRTTHYKIVRSNLKGNKLTWRGGLEGPMQVGPIVESTSAEPSPGTGNPVKASLQIAARRPFKRPPWYPVPPVPYPIGIDEIVVKLVMRDAALQTKLAEFAIGFVGSLGMYYVTGQTFGVPTVLQLADCSGWH